MCDDGCDLSSCPRRESVCAHAVNRAGLRVEDSLMSRRRKSRLKFLAGNSGLQTKLQLRFGGAKECLVDLWLVGVQGDVGAGAVGVTLEDDIVFGTNLEESSELKKNRRVRTFSCSRCC